MATLARLQAAVLTGVVLLPLLGGLGPAAAPVWTPHPAAAWAMETVALTGPRAPSPVSAKQALSSPLLDPHWVNVTVPGGAAPPAGPGVLAYDAKDSYVLWYGLAAPGAVGGQTWTFASGTWTNRTASAGAGPSGATWGTAAFDPADGYVVWYGGGNVPASAATWTFASGKWTNLTASLAAQPTPARILASGAYDPALGGVVVFGGWDGSAYLNDTWLFYHGAWSTLTGSLRPAPRVSAGLAYDGGDGYLVLAGGGTSTGPAADTWALTGSNWSELVAAGGSLGFGGAQGLTDAPGGSVIGFGGAGCVAPLQGPCNLTEEFATGAWQPIVPDTGPSPRTGMQLVYDANDGAVLAWGGSTGPTRWNDTWELGGPLHLRAIAAPALVGPDDNADFVAFAGGGYGAYSFTWTGAPADCPVVNASVMDCESEIPGNYTLVSHLSDAAGNVTTAFAAFQVLHELSANLVISPSTIDLGQSASLAVTVIGGARVVNYSWVGLPVGCSAPYLDQVNCTPVSPGYYSILVSVTDALGHLTTTPDLALLVNALPTVGIWANVTLGAGPLPVQFFSSVFGGSPTYTFRWTFGDAGTSTAPDPAHVYASSGVYAVGLTVTDARGGVTGSSNLTLDVLNPLVVQAEASATYPNQGQSVVFSALVSGGESPYSYAWTFGDGAISNAAQPAHAFTDSGTHTVVLVVTDAHGINAVSTAVIDVQGSASSGGGGGSIFTSPWVDGLIGAMIGIAVATFAIRTPPPPEAPAPLPRRAAPGAESAPTTPGPPDATPPAG